MPGRLPPTRRRSAASINAELRALAKQIDTGFIKGEQLQRYELLMLPEETWRQQARQLGRLHGYTIQYHTHRSDRSDRGFYDEVWLHPERGRLLLFEFKKMGGIPTAEQTLWLETAWEHGYEAACWWPDERSMLCWWITHPHRVCQECILDYFDHRDLPSLPYDPLGCIFGPPAPDVYAHRNGWVSRAALLRAGLETRT